MVKYVFSKVDAIIYHSRIQNDFYENILNLSKDKLFFVPFGIDPLEFVPAEGDNEDYVLSAGDGGRDYATLLEASKLVNSKIRLISRRYKYKNEDLPENVDYFDYLPISKLKKMIGSAKFIVLPLKDVPASCGQSVLLQSMAMKKAVIVSNVPGVIDYVIDGETAILCKPNSPNDLSAKINYLLNNPEEVKRIGENARKSVLSNFNEDRMGSRIYDIMLKINQKKTRT